MTERYRNTGGPHRKPDGTQVGQGEVFKPTERDLDAFGHKFEPVEGSGPVSGADIGLRSLPMTDAALELALEAGLDESDFESIEPEGSSGDYLKSQVEALL